MQVYFIKSFVFILLLITCVEINGNRIKDQKIINEHILAEDHNSQVDHEAFLGSEESKTFDNLSEEESKDRLRNLIKQKVDLDGDDFVTEKELKQWISLISKLTKEKERDDMFKMFTNSSLLDYDTYFNRTFGPFSADSLDEVAKENLEKVKLQDNRKWEIVDKNKDNKLDKTEFLMFLHPEDYSQMRPLVIQEALDISDKNKDGYLNLEEYISDIWSPSSGSEQPDENMLNLEHDNFKNHRDINKDGKLDKEEIGEWLMPTNYDATDSETQHLMHHADANKDGKLSIEEIMDSHEIFVGSQATDYGNSLKHEEL